MVVDKVVEALPSSSHSDQSMDDSSSENMSSTQEANDDMLLCHF